jgi:hypothetical protein
MEAPRKQGCQRQETTSASREQRGPDEGNVYPQDPSRVPFKESYLGVSG